MRSDPTLRRWFRLLRTKFFHDEITDSVCVRWADDDDDHEFEGDRLLGAADYCEDGRHKFEIILSRELNKSLTVALGTLIHEMVHIATELRDDHGPAFEAWRVKLAQRGIFKKNAVRKGCTMF